MLVDSRQRARAVPRRRGTWSPRRVNQTLDRPLRDRLRADGPRRKLVRPRACRFPCACAWTKLSRELIEVGAGKRFSVRVRTDARSYRWLFDERRGVGRREVLVLRAPQEAGSYTLYVTVGGRAARAEVIVAEPQ